MPELNKLLNVFIVFQPDLAKFLCMRATLRSLFSRMLFKQAYACPETLGLLLYVRSFTCSKFCFAVLCLYIFLKRSTRAITYMYVIHKIYNLQLTSDSKTLQLSFFQSYNTGIPTKILLLPFMIGT